MSKIKVKKKQAKELKAWAKALAEASGRDFEEVMNEMKAELKKIIAKPLLKSFDDEQKVVHAIRILKATHTTPLTQSGRDFELLILDFTKPKKITPRDTTKEPFIRADVFAIGLCVEDGATSKEQELMYCELALYRENTDLIGQLKRGVTYKTQVTAKLESGKWNLGAIDNLTHFKEADEQLDMNIEEFLEEQFQLIAITDAEYNICNKKKGELRLVRGNVTYANVHTSDGGYTYGRFVIIDDSLDVEDIRKHGGLSIMVDKSQVLYAEGSDLMVLGAIDKSDKDKIGMSGKAVIPIIPIPRAVQEDDEPEEYEEDDDDIDDDDEINIGGAGADEQEEDAEEEEEPEEEDEPEEEEEEEKPKPKPKSKKSEKAKPKKKPEPKEEEEEDDDDDDDEDEDGGSIDL